MAAIAYVDRQGVIGFCHDGETPRGAQVFARHRSKQELYDLVKPKARLAPDGETLLVPGVHDVASEAAAMEALDMWRDWSFPDATVMHGAVLLTDDGRG
jgi:hypothetical protein